MCLLIIFAQLQIPCYLLEVTGLAQQKLQTACLLGKFSFLPWEIFLGLNIFFFISKITLIFSRDKDDIQKVKEAQKNLFDSRLSEMKKNCILPPTILSKVWPWHDLDMTLTWPWHDLDITLTWPWHDLDMTLTCIILTLIFLFSCRSFLISLLAS